MFPGYDPDRKPPYTKTIIKVINDKVYKVLYAVGNGPAGSISISSYMELVDDSDLECEEE